MIPSPTKLALLTGVVLLLGECTGRPTRYDQRQEGELNVRADVSDVIVVAVPPKDYVSGGFSWFESNLLRRHPGPNANRIPSRTASKHGFVPSEKSPYKVDLGKSSVPLAKLQSPVVEEVKLYRIREAGDGGGSRILVDPAERKTVKKAEAEGAGVAAAEEATAEVSKAEATTAAAAKVQEETNEKGSDLVVVMNNSDPDSIMRWDDCGPDGHRDGTGKCVYE